MKKKLFGVALLAWVLLSLWGSAFAADIYIPDDYPTIQEGIDAATTGSKVIVRDGTYLLSAALDFKGKAITVKSEKGLGNCFLDGEQKTRVVYFHSGETSKSVLSGFVIRNGQADKGGGILCDSSSPTISNCKIMANKAYVRTTWAYAYGGGIYCNASSTIIANCEITGNRAETYSWNRDQADGAASHGGGIYFNGGSPIIKDSIVTGNMVVADGESSYSFGGGVYFSGSSPSITSSIIKNNTTSAINSSQGGGMFFTASFPSIVNTIINGNSSKHGAGIYFNSSPGSLTNCTIVRNTANQTAGGGAMYCAKSSPTIVNSILWQDYADVGYNEIAIDATSSPSVTYSCVLGGYDGTGNIDANPLFVDIASGNFHLKPNSPCIDKGTNDAPELPEKDKDGKPRIVNGIVDMGAYEYQTPPPPVISSFTATPTAGFPDLLVKFTCKATDADGSIVKYVWDFGDGNSIETTTGETSHTYSVASPDEIQTFTATVRVFDNANFSTLSNPGIPIRVGHGPDLVGKVEEYFFVAATKTVNMKLRVTNTGDRPAGPFTVSLHLAYKTTNPLVPFKKVTVEGLAAGEDLLLTIKSTPKNFIYGEYVLVFIDLDKTVSEIDETNNGTKIQIVSMATK